MWRLQSLVLGRSCETLPPADTLKIRPGTFPLCVSLRKCFVWLSLLITVPGETSYCGCFSSLASSHKTVFGKGCLCAGLRGSLLGNAQEVRQKMRKYQTVCFTLSFTQDNLSQCNQGLRNREAKHKVCWITSMECNFN